MHLGHEIGYDDDDDLKKGSIKEAATRYQLTPERTGMGTPKDKRYLRTPSTLERVVLV
jgi:hypothetical protein